MSDFKQDKEAKEFVKRWADRSSEKEFSQKFWIDLLSNVYGVEQVTEYLEFEKPVIIDGNTKFIDVYIPSTKVIIEQKSGDKDLTKAQKQSDGALLSPMGQMKRYADNMKFSERPRWGISCNFHDIMIFDFEYPNSEPELIKLADLPKELHRLDFLIKKENVRTQREVEISIAAGAIVGKIYDALKKNYKEETEETLKSLNILCVRLIFCLYAEDSGIFSKDQFYYYMKTFPETKFRSALKELFTVLNTPLEEREYGLEEDLNAFPYVNGGLFAEEIELPKFDVETVTVILEEASIGFNWKHISPTIFGAVFESTLSTKLRRAGGMHYTSIENIHKVIDPLFLDELNDEFNTIISKKYNRISEKKEKLRVFQDKIANLTFLDPACGSGNFLTETFISLRKLENKILLALYTESASAMLDFGDEFTPVKVNIHQFYGIEINDFAVSVAKTALWIAEYQMLEETQSIVNRSLDFLPLKSYSNIVESNALRIDWKEVIAPEKLNYIMGNPPFIGASMMTTIQKSEAVNIYGKIKLSNSIDYVGAWYFKASQILCDTQIKCAFVSTNSITQGEQVSALWKPLYDRYNIHIDFAWPTFKWDSESIGKAAVHVVIISFSCTQNNLFKLYNSNNSYSICQNITPYLIDAPLVFIESKSKPICNVPKMCLGNKPADGGNLILTEDDVKNILDKEPNLKKYIYQYLGATEYINKKIRYCFWLKDITPQEIRKSNELTKRLHAVKEMRENSSAKPTREKANQPHLFFFISQPKNNYILVPSTSSENRKYIPIGFVPPEIIASNSATIIPDGDIYNFGVLTSNVHMEWMRTVAGRLEMRYRYSNSIVYNNFPWCTPTEQQKAKIEKTAQAILNARALYPNSSLADLYDELTMPPELRKAHQANDKAVMEAYGFIKKVDGKATWYSPSECVAALMKMYQELTSKENK
jgi:type I restriction-modification system DNA methylase subunit